MTYKKRKISPIDYIVIPAVITGIIFFYYRIKNGLHYNWDWGAIPQYIFRFDTEKAKWLPNLLMQGLFNTIRLSVWGIIFATILGIIMGLFRVSKSLFRRLLGGTYVELVRNTPPLVIIFIFYFFFSSQIIPLLRLDEFINSAGDSTLKIISILFGRPAMFPTFLSAIVTMSIFEGAYVTEIIRAGIASVDRGQWEASYALGLNRYQQYRHIILPQATQRVLLPLAGQFISTIKDSAIVSVISIQELTFQGMELMSATYLTFETWITIAFMYLILSISLSLLIGRLDAYMRRKTV
ncbi:MAG: amino acid ABC transporter permease [Deltaproteobacteria bacterium]|nr:amino acid ABC transporter permease [Deltaproteobacteria bacterium]